MKKVIHSVIRRTLRLVLLPPFSILAYVRRKYTDKIYREISGSSVLDSVSHKGKGCVFYGPLDVISPHHLKLGDYVRIGEGSYLFCYGGLTIGDNTQISRDCTVYCANHQVEDDMLPYGEGYDLRPVTIGKSVWIGMNVTIVPGVHIGDGAIIGMGTIVSKNVAPGEVVVGSPQRSVKMRDMERFEDLTKERAYFGTK